MKNLTNAQIKTIKDDANSKMYAQKASSVSTTVCITEAGTIFFEHLMSGNQKKGCQIINGQNEMTDFTNEGYLRNYLISVKKLDYFYL